MGTPQRLRALLRHLGAGPQQEPAQSSSSPTRPAPAAASAGAPLGLTRILFQGDSITDAGRSREQTEPNAALGTGCARRNCWPGLLFCLTDPPPPYPPAGADAQMASAILLSERPEEDLQIFNRGVGGDRIVNVSPASPRPTCSNDDKRALSVASCTPAWRWTATTSSPS